MNTIHIYGTGDAKMRALKNNLSLALTEYPLNSHLEDVSEYNRIYTSGVTQPPALVINGEILCEGVVPSVGEIVKLLRNRHLMRSKLFKLRRMVVPVDMSQASENALIYACKLAHLFQASVEVVYCMDSIFEGSVPSPSGVLANYKNTMQEELDHFVQQVADREKLDCPTTTVGNGHQEPGNTVAGIRTRIAFGFPEDVLIDLSRNTDMMVMGTLGKGNISRKLFGSVSVSVSKHAHCPVLLVPPQSQFRGFSDILYASNFESLEALTIKQTVAFARRFNSQLHFVHVGRPGEEGVDLEKKLFEINYIYADPEMPFLFSKVTGEDVVESLHEYAFHHHIGLFVFVTHHRSFWDNLLHHSISKDMLLHTGIPVLIIHSDSDSKE
ncbi:MAG: universal stress protein [Saprospiraceae bacterium]|nr:universal stress protein [Saprospiraceae bacterium]